MVHGQLLAKKWPESGEDTLGKVGVTGGDSSNDEGQVLKIFALVRKS